MRDFDRMVGHRNSLDRWHWLEFFVPTVAGIVIFGPAFAPGALLHHNLVLVPALDLPSALGGLGADSPDRLPLWLPIAAVSRWVSTEWVGKLLILGVIVGAWLGMVRLVRHHGLVVAHSAGLLYAMSPLLMTRLGIGDLGVAAAAAVLPWVLPALVQPGRDRRATFVAAAVAAFTGPFGGTMAVLIVVISILSGSSRRWSAAIGVTVLAQLPWVMPVVLVAGHPPQSPISPTIVDGTLGLLRLSAGHGFGDEALQVGSPSGGAAIAGLVLLGLAAFGSRRLDQALRRPLVVLGILGWLVAVASSFEIVTDALATLTSHRLLAAWRDPQRLQVLHILWLAPAAALGAVRLGRGFHDCRVKVRACLSAIPAIVGLVAVSPGVWGADQQLDAARLPQVWTDIRMAINDAPGTVVALPWSNYIDLQIRQDPPRSVLHPLPAFLGGDVISPEDEDSLSMLGGADPRVTSVAALLESLDDGNKISAGLVDLGVRWVVALKPEPDGRLPGLYADPGLTALIDGEGAVGFQVDRWIGPAVTADGGAVEVDRLAPGVVRLQSPLEVVWNQPAEDGWRRGAGQELTATADGRLRVPSGEGLVWQWRALPIALSQLVWMGALSIGLADRSQRRSRKLNPRWGKRRLATWDALVKDME